MIYAVWIAGMVLGVLIVIVGRQKKKMLLRDIGLGLFVGGFIGLTLHGIELREMTNMMNQHRDKNEKLITDLRESIITAYYGRLIPQELSEEIGRHIIRDPFYYEEFVITGNFVEYRDRSSGQECLRLNLNNRYRVHNMLSRPATFSLVSQIIDSTADIPPGINRIIVESNSNPENNIDLLRPQIEDIAVLDTSNVVLRFQKNFLMGKDETLSVTIESVAYPDLKDYYLITALHPCKNMKVRLTFPEGYETYCVFNHPGESNQNYCDCVPRGRHVNAEIKVAVLPLQGLLVGWSKNN